MRPIPALTTEQLARFWSKVDKSGECWLWTAFLDKDGYGQFGLGRSNYLRANRVSYAIANGDPGALNVNHTCDNPPCVNPAHLWAGTQKEGMLDKVAKNRQLKGETHSLSKLTEKQVEKILTSDETQQALADRYGVVEGTIRAIKCGKTWTHLGGEQHTGPLRSDNKTGVKGVSLYRGGRYDARFRLNKKLYLLGQFNTVKEATQAITQKRLELSCKID